MLSVVGCSNAGTVDMGCPQCLCERYVYVNDEVLIVFNKLTLKWKKLQGCGAVTFLVGSGSGSGSGEAFRLRHRLRLRVKLFGGSGSGSGSGQNVPAPAAPAPAPAPAPMLKSSYGPYLTSNTIFKKCQISKYDLLLT